MTAWRLLADDGAGAAEGLALDEALMASHARGLPPATPVLRLYGYASHSALCGRYQHLDAEIDREACARTGTGFNRRPTGGGAIVMGRGQLGVAVVMRADAAERPKDTLLRMSRGVVRGLARLGVDAEFGGKNDLVVNGRKVAGLGLYLDGAGGLLFHSSVLADLDVPFMLDVLRIPAAKLGGEGVAAVEKRVTTVSRETGGAWDAARLRDVVAEGFAEVLGAELAPSEPTEAERSLAARLVETKYTTDAWLHQQAPRPDATATSLLRTPGGLVRLYLALQGDLIKSALFTGDFNEIPEPLVRFETALKWSRLDAETLGRVARDTVGDDTGLGVSVDALIEALLAAGGRAVEREVAAPHRTGSCYFPEGGPT